jgi:C-terminal processing protease CtpA/Prc
MNFLSKSAVTLVLLAIAPTSSSWLLTRRTKRTYCSPPSTSPPSINKKLSQFLSDAASCASTAAILVGLIATFSPPLPAVAIESSIVEGQIPALNPAARRYSSTLSTGTPSEISSANEALLDYAVGTINTMYYDSTGGYNFDARGFYTKWGALRSYARDGEEGLERWKRSELKRIERGRADWIEIGGGGTVPNLPKEIEFMPEDVFGSRENAVRGLNWLVGTLHDPFSKYLTKDQLLQELKESSNNGLLGLGAIVEAPQRAPDTLQLLKPAGEMQKQQMTSRKSKRSINKAVSRMHPSALTTRDVANLPVVTAVIADSRAERLGIVVGDRIVAVGSDQFLELSRDEFTKRLDSGLYDIMDDDSNKLLVVAKPIVATQNEAERDYVLGYRVSRLNLHKTKEMSAVDDVSSDTSIVAGGDSVVHYKLLTPADSIFRKVSSEGDEEQRSLVGYIRLTRFSRAATAGYLNAVNELEAAGAQSYIVDLRNNYGGVIQEAMLAASTLLRDPHAVLCYTLNSRGGFTPHDAEEYIVDRRFAGYLLSSEPPSVTLDQVKLDDPQFYEDEGTSWVPPSAYASLHEQGVKRGIHRTTTPQYVSTSPNDIGLKIRPPPVSKVTRASDKELAEELHHLRAQKKMVLLINEGTASSAEVFASALHDNGRIVALVGAKTYGKGLVQHTFAMPDGGGLRITVSEYLTPALKHVTSVGAARYDPLTGDLVGGGIRPDIQCSSNQGIPSNAGADICVGVALDVLENSEAEDQRAALQLVSMNTKERLDAIGIGGRLGGRDGGSGIRKPVIAGSVRVRDNALPLLH